jgi:transcriptional regulator with XRE-family HTH domain
MTQLITIQQVKAARALLGWSQDDLAKLCGMSKPALANFERGATSSRINNLNSVRNTFENAGIEFITDEGVRLVRDRLEVQIFNDKDNISLLWEDIYNTLEPGEERLISSVDESKFTAATKEAFPAMMQRYKEKGIKGRILSLEGDRNFADPTSQYKWVPKSQFHDIAYYIYGDKYAILLWEPAPRVILIKNKVMAENYRKQFNRHWFEAKIP